MNAEYKKATEKLLCGITDKRLHEPAIWNDILSSVRSGKLRLWEINDIILRIKYFCKEKIERASTFTESDKSGGHAAAGLYPHNEKRLHRADAKRVCRAA